MGLEQKFEGVTWDNTVSACDLERNRKYPILRAKTITTRMGSAVLLTNGDSLEDSSQVFLPKRYRDVVTDDDIEKINTNLSLNVVYRVICSKTKANLLAKEM